MPAGVAIEAKGVIITRVRARVHRFITGGNPSATSRRVHLLTAQLRISCCFLPTIPRARGSGRIGGCLRSIIAMPNHLAPTTIVAAMVVVVAMTVSATETTMATTVSHARRYLREGAKVTRNFPRPPAKGIGASLMARVWRREPEVVKY
jgi:hypothetical protein